MFCEMLRAFEQGFKRNIVTSILQVIEIGNLNGHLLTECDKKAEFKKCPRCQEAVLKVDFDNHLKTKSCPGAIHVLKYFVQWLITYLFLA